MIGFRAGTFDAKLFAGVALADEYRLPRKLSGTVLDIGANIGAFTLTAAARGASLIHAYEPNKSSFDVLTHNVESIRDIVHYHYQAVWGNPCPEYVLLSKGGSCIVDGRPVANPGSCTVTNRAKDDDANGIKAVSFDSIACNLGRIDWCKIDAEGAEWPILLTSAEIWRVKNFCGEYHSGLHSDRFTIGDVVNRLTSMNYDVRIRPNHFWARRLS